MARPNWMPATVWLGIDIGSGALQAFNSEDEAVEWAGDAGAGTSSPGAQRRVWVTTMPDDVEVFEAEFVPAKRKKKKVDR